MNKYETFIQKTNIGNRNAVCGVYINQKDRAVTWQVIFTSIYLHRRELQIRVHDEEDAQYGLDFGQTVSTGRHRAGHCLWEDLGTTVKFSDVEGITLEGTEIRESKRYVEMQVLRDFRSKIAIVSGGAARKDYHSGIGMECPGHNHVTYHHR